MKELRALAVLWTCVLLTHTVTGANPFYAGVRPNGTMWFSFGPGVIAAARSARCYVVKNRWQETWVVTGESDMAALRTFLDLHFTRRFDLSPLQPCLESADAAYGVTLYSSPKPEEDCLLVYIPFVPNVTGPGCDQLIDEFRKHVASFKSKVRPGDSDEPTPARPTQPMRIQGDQTDRKGDDH